MENSNLFAEFADAIQPHLKPTISVEEIEKLISDKLEQSGLMRPIEIHLNNSNKDIIKMEGTIHHQFDDIIEMVNEGARNILLVGPSGSGKSTIAKNLADALGIDYGFISFSAGVTETHLFGRILPQSDGTWKHQPTKFLDIYSNGGVFVFDEMAAADANLLVSVNSALANGHLANPVTGEVYKRHAECYIIACDNTYGRGANHQYVGRNQLDASTLDRFCLATIEINYDEKLEQSIMSSLDSDQKLELTNWVKGLREKIERNKLRRIASTRLIVHATRAMAAGRSLKDIQTRYFLDWSTDEKSKLN